MALSRDVKNYALTGFPGHSRNSYAGREPEPTPQLFRLIWQWRRDLECRARHAAAQRFSLAHTSLFYDYHWHMASLGLRGITDLRNLVARHRNGERPGKPRLLRENRQKILADLREQLNQPQFAADDGDDREIRALLIERACHDVRTGIRRQTKRAANRVEDRELSEADYASFLAEAVTQKATPAPPPGSVCVLLSEPQVRSRDEAAGATATKVGKPKQLGGPADQHAIDTFYAQRFEESPWHQPAIEWMWRAHLALLEEPVVYFRLPPVLLIGPPGCGRTHFAERLAEKSGVTRRRIDMSAISSGFAITGVESGWSLSRPGEAVCAIADGDYANPVIILDEVEKCRANSGAADPLLALLPLLQRDSAARFRCPALRAEIDLSHITWILTANEVGRLPAPLLDRVTVFQCAAPTGTHLRHHVNRRLGDFAVDASVLERVTHEIESGRLSLRGLGRLEDQVRRISRAPRNLI